MRKKYDFKKKPKTQIALERRYYIFIPNCYVLKDCKMVHEEIQFVKYLLDEKQTWTHLVMIRDLNTNILNLLKLWMRIQEINTQKK